MKRVNKQQSISSTNQPDSSVAGRVRHYIKLIISSLFHPMFRHHHYHHYTTTSNPPTTTTFTSPNLTEPLYNERNEEYGQKTKLSFMTPIPMHGALPPQIPPLCTISNRHPHLMFQPAILPPPSLCHQ